MTINCDECPCLSESKCNLGYTVSPRDIGGAFLPGSDDCKLIKIVTEDDGEIFPTQLED
jgi:hypothetical protein